MIVLAIYTGCLIGILLFFRLPVVGRLTLNLLFHLFEHWLEHHGDLFFLLMYSGWPIILVFLLELLFGFYILAGYELVTLLFLYFLSVLFDGLGH